MLSYPSHEAKLAQMIPYGSPIPGDILLLAYRAIRTVFKILDDYKSRDLFFLLAEMYNKKWRIYQTNSRLLNAGDFSIAQENNSCTGTAAPTLFSFCYIC